MWAGAFRPSPFYFLTQTGRPMGNVIGIVLTTALLILILKSMRSSGWPEFYRMANQYSEDGCFVDEDGNPQTNVDLLIDMYIHLKKTVPDGIASAVGQPDERHHSKVG